MLPPFQLDDESFAAFSQDPQAYLKRLGKRLSDAPLKYTLAYGTHSVTVSTYEDLKPVLMDLHYNPKILCSDQYRSSSYIAGKGFQAPLGGFGPPKSVNGAFYAGSSVTSKSVPNQDLNCAKQSSNASATRPGKFHGSYGINPHKAATALHLPNSPDLFPPLGKPSTIQMNGVDLPGVQLPDETVLEMLERVIRNMKADPEMDMPPRYVGGSVQNDTIASAPASMAGLATPDAVSKPQSEILASMPVIQPALELRLNAPQARHSILPHTTNSAVSDVIDDQSDVLPKSEAGTADLFVQIDKKVAVKMPASLASDNEKHYGSGINVMYPSMPNTADTKESSSTKQISNMADKVEDKKDFRGISEKKVNFYKDEGYGSQDLFGSQNNHANSDADQEDAIITGSLAVPRKKNTPKPRRSLPLSLEQDNSWPTQSPPASSQDSFTPSASASATSSVLSKRGRRSSSSAIGPNPKRFKTSQP